MQIQQILQARANRETRLGRPFSIFFATAQQCVAAGDLLLEGGVDLKVASLVERSAVISTVTAIEVYYKDLLTLIFKYCAPSFFEPHLKQLFQEKFDISDLIEMHRHCVHPLEVVAAGQSFQNVERIDKVFSRFLDGGGLWQQVLGLQVRLGPDTKPGEEMTWDQEGLAALRRVFDLRHELVHDPARSSFFTQQTVHDLWSAVCMVFGSDVLLTHAIQANRDPELDKE